MQRARVAVESEWCIENNVRKDEITELGKKMRLYSKIKLHNFPLV